MVIGINSGRPMPGGNVGFGAFQLFGDELPGAQNVVIVLENDRNYRQSEPGNGANFGFSGQVGEHEFERKSDELFHFLRGQRGIISDNLDLVGGDVGDGSEGNFLERIQPPNRQAAHQQPDCKFVFYGKSDE